MYILHWYSLAASMPKRVRSARPPCRGTSLTWSTGLTGTGNRGNRQCILRLPRYDVGTTSCVQPVQDKWLAEESHKQRLGRSGHCCYFADFVCYMLLHVVTYVYIYMYTYVTYGLSYGSWRNLDILSNLERSEKQVGSIPWKLGLGCNMCKNRWCFQVEALRKQERESYGEIAKLPTT